MQKSLESFPRDINQNRKSANFSFLPFNFPWSNDTRNWNARLHYSVHVVGKSLIMESFTEKALNRNPILDSMRIQKQQGQMNSSFEKRRGSKRGVRKKGEIQMLFFTVILKWNLVNFGFCACGVTRFRVGDGRFWWYLSMSWGWWINWVSELSCSILCNTISVCK